jgi:peptidoglycan hydrolase CwlO-like protein
MTRRWGSIAWATVILLVVFALQAVSGARLGKFIERHDTQIDALEKTLEQTKKAVVAANARLDEIQIRVDDARSEVDRLKVRLGPPPPPPRKTPIRDLFDRKKERKE